VALITGAGQGIGKETALLFAHEGAKVVVADLNETTGAQTANEITKSGGTGVFIKANIAKQAEAKSLVEETKKRFGRIDILLNNAGIMRDATLLKMTEESFDQVIEVNLKGTFNCTQAIAPIMIEQGKGKIINVSSIVGLYGNFGQTNYVASKAGIIGMTKVWARELGRKNICVNVVCPGFIETEMLQSVPEKILQMMKEKVPLGRFAKPLDVAKVYLFLASDDSDYVNGAVISVDGGVVV
jgi:3-oxoacyl-[acyl-carrier protein] reductase